MRVRLKFFGNREKPQPFFLTRNHERRRYAPQLVKTANVSCRFQALALSLCPQRLVFCIAKYLSTVLVEAVDIVEWVLSSDEDHVSQVRQSWSSRLLQSQSKTIYRLSDPNVYT